MKEFKVGDVVQLKSGGPLMTITRVEHGPIISTDIMRYGCVWFDEINGMARDAFIPDVLQEIRVRKENAE